MSLPIVLSGIYVLLTAGITLGVVICALTHLEAVRRGWRSGLWLSGAAALLSVPGWGMTLSFFDPSVLLVDADLPPELVERAADTAWWAMAAGVGVFAALGLVYRVLLVSVAELADPQRPAFPALVQTPPVQAPLVQTPLVQTPLVQTPLVQAPLVQAPLVRALALGLVLGLLSTALVWALGIEVSELVSRQADLFPGISMDDPRVLLGVGLPSALSAAISEELLFRGVVQRWLSRWWGPAVSIGITSGIWALGHAANTDALLLKMVQIGALGVVFGVLARRHGVEASLVAHLGLNTAAALAVVVLP